MLKTIKKIYNVISAAVIAVIIILALLLVGVKLIGLEPYTVLSGSMEPKYHVGSVIYVKDVDPKELKVGDPLTFKHQGATVTHEIIEIVPADDPNEMKIVTQGLTNNISDGEIPVSNIIGKPVFSIPYLGYVAQHLQNPKGMFSAICVVIVLLVLSGLLDYLTDDKKKRAPDNSSVFPDPSADPDGCREDNINDNKNEEEKQ